MIILPPAVNDFSGLNDIAEPVFIQTLTNPVTVT